ncbi:MAG: glucokinase [Fluviicola sp. XM-24bin1]|nr:MAG: glucokinase [Fluviicola sp. XM-24bin1]
MKTKIALGVDVGGTNVAFGLCDEKGNSFFESSFPTKSFDTPELLIEDIYQVVEKQGLIDCLTGIGIGAPNGNINSGTIEFAPNLHWKGSIPLAALFEERFGKPAILTNDANAAAIGERIYGNAKDLDDFVLITLGTGLGSGIVANGRLLYGHDGFAGEYGHFRVIPNGRSCGCGRRGCLETYVSATGVVRSVTELESPNKATSALLKLETVSAEDVFELATNGDTFAEEIIEYTAAMLGSALADYTCFSSPKAYVLFGGIAQSGAPFAEKVKTYMEREILNIYQNKIEIRISSLHDKNAAVLGSCSLVWNELN